MSLNTIKSSIRIINSTNSTSITTGSLTCLGGLGISGNIQSNGYVGIGGAIGDFTFPLNVNGNTQLTGYVSVYGASYSYPLNVNGSINCDNIISVNETVNYGSNYTVGGGFNFGLGTLTTSASYALSVGGSAIFGNGMNVFTNSDNSSPINGVSGPINIYFTLGLNGSNPNPSYGIYSTQTYYTYAPVYSTGQSVISDIRTKKNISLIDNIHSLNILRLLSPKKYKYIKNDKYVQYGFIAQDVKYIIPEAVTINNHEEFIPDIYDNAIVSDYNDYSIITLNEKSLSFTIINDKLKLKAYNNDKEYILEPIEIINNKTFKVKKINETNIFIYGKNIHDFHLLNYNSIYITAISAFKELDRQVQEKKMLNTKLLERLNLLEQL